MRAAAAFLASLIAGSTSIAFAQGSQNSGGPAALVVVPGIQHDLGDEANARETPAFGTASPSAYSLVAHAFQPVDSGVTFGYFTNELGNVGIYRTNPAGNPWLFAPLHLPNGSLLERFEFRFCDTSATRAFFSYLVINDKTGSFVQPELVTSTNAETPGCINRVFDPATPFVVDNDLNAYSLEVNLGGFGTAGDNTVVLGQARVYYRLQVSPAPAVATFPVDVPTSHPFFRFIEALAAAGITAGCNAGAFCPDQAVTRGQMAVFLAAALGLHFPN
jgi:hypothetical protein